jgi:hypothetical protein
MMPPSAVIAITVPRSVKRETMGAVQEGSL